VNAIAQQAGVDEAYGDLLPDQEWKRSTGLAFVDYMDRLVASESSPGEIRGETIALTAVLC
jgi:hypothetical protein